MESAHASLLPWRQHSSTKEENPADIGSTDHVHSQYQSKWLRLQQCLPHVFRVALVDAIIFGPDDVLLVHLLQQLHSLSFEYPTSFLQDTIALAATVAASLGHVALLGCLVPSPRLPTNAIMDNAAAHGHLQILQFLDSTSLVFPCSTNAMDLGARNGHYDVVRWLHLHRLSTGCTANAMAWAAWKGHDRIVRYLHTHQLSSRPELDGGRSIDLAAQANRLPMVQWLHGHGYDTTVESLEVAARRGFVELLAWLVKTFPDKCTVKVMYHAASRHDEGMVHMLHANTDPTYTTDVVRWARQRGHRLVAAYVESVLQLGKVDRGQSEDVESILQDFDSI
ncbi:hypothetical protein B5M09_010455 [Aphanomyces astaci]|uniref:Uncharacterized protein n=1 Tax=Aphanomyces astaci TaxID=112090 RepID=A0A3R7YUE1_APHAT|nr:hypothetical protein B5M09_010455 [Aphanomyces astaci]